MIEKEQLDNKNETIAKLNSRISQEQNRVKKIEKKLEEALSTIERMKDEHELERISLSKLTSERSSWLRKLKRAGIK